MLEVECSYMRVQIVMQLVIHVYVVNLVRLVRERLLYHKFRLDTLVIVLGLYISELLVHTLRLHLSLLLHVLLSGILLYTQLQLYGINR